MINKRNYPSGECVVIDGKTYRIGELINQGTDGRIYAVHPIDSVNSAVVVKYFDCMYGDSLWSSALREIEASKRLAKCPYTMDVIGYCARRDEFHRAEIFILMERMECCAQMALNEEEILEMGADICRALEYMRRKGLVHSDVKPANIFLNSSGKWQLGDFGCVQLAGKSQRSGSAGYCSPEVYRNERCDVRSDIYSLGITLYKLLSGGRFPFCSEPAAQIENSAVNSAIERRMTGDCIPPIEGVCMEINQIILKMCEFEPRKRYSSPAKAARCIDRIINKRHVDFA